ncbi:hypothetical protein D3C77_731490 [compost metagenome]
MAAYDVPSNSPWRSQVTSPSSRVSCTWVLWMLPLGASSNRLRSSTMRSADLPTSMEPALSSMPMHQAPLRVITRIACSRLMGWP